MRKLAVLTVFAVSMSGAYALNAQQQLMGTCNAQAKASNKTGDERKAFMKSCLADGRKGQQEKMKTCNVEAKDKKGDERKAFMKACLSKKLLLSACIPLRTGGMQGPAHPKIRWRVVSTLPGGR